jgi:KaiC/GvpD/RAD55 family RecA-like ATPase
LRYRRQILQLKQYFAGQKCTVLLLDDCSSGARDLQIESIAHGVFTLHRSSPDYGIARRQLNIQVSCRLRDLRGIALTGYGMEQDMARSEEAGSSSAI